MKLDLQEQLEKEGYDAETIEAVLNEMFNGKSGSSGLESGLSVQNPQTGLNPAESLQLSLITGYKNTLVGVYTSELTQEQAKAKIKDFSLAAAKKIKTFNNVLQGLAKEKAEDKKARVENDEANNTVDNEILAASPSPDDENQATASDVLGNTIYGTSLTT
jgi:hypothetical protein